MIAFTNWNVKIQKVSMKLPDLSSALSAAPALLGWKLVHDSAEGRTAGYIVETEAYTMEDPASHTFGGPTARNAAMFEAAGTIYVYFTYGMHYCVNIVTGDKGYGQAVLIRALEPVEGIELMQQRRGTGDIHSLTNGPAKLVQAMGINKELYGSHISQGPLLLEPGVETKEIIQTTRVGIKKAIDQPWRFYVAGNPYVSKR
jgi:DNA-3-methyladenine glycosylase